jgi:intracellular multiplication protein IcmL
MAKQVLNDHDEIASGQNAVYRKRYGKMVSILVALVLLMAIVTPLFLLVIFKPTPPRYYTTTTTGDVKRLSSLSEPVVTDAYLRKWVATIAGGIFTVSFNSWQTQIKRYQDNFTPLAWQSLMNSYTNGGFADTLTNNQLISSAVVNGTPRILDRSIINGEFTWFVSVPILVNYTSASAQTQQMVNLSITVSRVPVLSVPQGIQISHFRAKITQRAAGGSNG